MASCRHRLPRLLKPGFTRTLDILFCELEPAQFPTLLGGLAILRAVN